MLPMLLMLLSRLLNPGVAQRRDSYLEAYAESHGTSTSPYGHISRDPGVVYGAPTEYEYYEEHTYPTTSTSYGPPGHTMYGPPMEMMGNGGDMPSSMVGLPRGLDFATICKIILKVLIFKLIVKFIAVICVLLFLPKLDMGSSSSSSSDDRAFKNEYAVDDLTRLVLQSIEKGGDVASCKDKNSTSCILQRVSRLLDNQNTFPRLLKLFLAEEQAKQKRDMKPKKH